MLIFSLIKNEKFIQRVMKHQSLWILEGVARLKLEGGELTEVHHQELSSRAVAAAVVVLIVIPATEAGTDASLNRLESGLRSALDDVAAARRGSAGQHSAP